MQHGRDDMGPAPQGLTSEPVDPMSMQEQPSADVARFVEPRARPDPPFPAALPAGPLDEIGVHASTLWHHSLSAAANADAIESLDLNTCHVRPEAEGALAHGM